ncbi:hypothetical protein HYH03_008717 [Edaphochlamys debaryana]|uniref:PhoD-like phosphatase domain-containing protein n=1 Tax=Edaphochlamys debaryana TaxID=47281 RepID=A0A835Y8M5_9CHLO|nr:hypothetical protein HYH03_008717 [Edaphochlamys debaryana]|eukprot:KAG2493054.1 hypothetical protein HYH03_008717 [Edaphochlamys debaryana]
MGNALGCGPKPEPAAPPPPDAFLPYYTLSSLGGRELFGPFLKLVAYNPDTAAYRFSVLVVVSEAAQARILPKSDKPTLTHTLADDPTFLPLTVTGELLEAWRGWRFWRFAGETSCGEREQTLKYTIDLFPGGSVSVTLPPASGPWHWAFATCNGLDDPANKNRTGGLQPLWTDLLAQHAQRPLHAIVGGGDQIYNDGVFKGPNLTGWDQTLRLTDTATRALLPFHEGMRNEVEEFYFSHYCVHMAQPVYAQALASIPSVNTWDDHDIVDGWGSYPDAVHNSAVMQGVFRAAQKFYYLFQQHTTTERAPADGYVYGSSQLLHLGRSTALVLPDTRTSRTLNTIMPPDYYDYLAERLRGLPDYVQHVVVVLAVPIMYPKLHVRKVLEAVGDAVARDTALNTILQKTGLIRLLPFRFGEVEVLDDLLDHWDSAGHCRERERAMRLFMDIAAEKGLRVSVLAGDVHCAGYAMAHSLPPGAAGGREGAEHAPLPSPEQLAGDPCFVPQVISSAIANVPPPTWLLKVLMEAGEEPKPLLEHCVTRQVSLMSCAAEGARRSDRDWVLVGERNWCRVGAGEGGGLAFELRCESPLGSGKARCFVIKVPPLLR